MHPVEDAKGQADVHNGCPHGIAVEAELCRVIKLRPGSKCWHDPELFRKETKRTVMSARGNDEELVQRVVEA